MVAGKRMVHAGKPPPRRASSTLDELGGYVTQRKEKEKNKAQIKSEPRLTWWLQLLLLLGP